MLATLVCIAGDEAPAELKSKRGFSASFRKRMTKICRKDYFWLYQFCAERFTLTLCNYP
jgi:hypothetical protein